jgi:hypothetical protein
MLVSWATLGNWELSPSTREVTWLTMEAGVAAKDRWLRRVEQERPAHARSIQTEAARDVDIRRKAPAMQKSRSQLMLH